MTCSTALLIKLQYSHLYELAWLRHQVLQACQLQSTLPCHIQRIAHTARAENDLPMTHVYLEGPISELLSAAQRDNLSQDLSEQLQGTAEVSRLQSVMQLEGPAVGTAPTCHYAVETDIEQDWREEVYRWYNLEHLPGLAQVPGCVRAQRWINIDHGPASFACYDITGPEVLSSAAWLNIRGTAWSSQCRPHFRNTLRTLFQNCQWPMPSE